MLNFSDVDIFRHWRLTREPTVTLRMDDLGVVDQLVIDYHTRELHIRPSES